MAVSGLPDDRVLDTLGLARDRSPSAANSLDALCARYGIDASRRRLHGALLDATLLAEVYIELIGGRQPLLLGLGELESSAAVVMLAPSPAQLRPVPLPARLTYEELERHAALVATLGSRAIWLSYGPMAEAAE
jgi:DNA polymerase-3 subunit epsilon